MKIGILGTGVVGEAIGRRLIELARRQAELAHGDQ